MKEFPKNMLENGKGRGTNQLHEIKNRQEQKDSPNAFTGII